MAEFETTFADLGLKAPILESLNDLGYEKPSPIQAECIPHLLSGRDVLGMAQTGSGKTAAFSLPLLNNIDPDLRAPQILVLAPTRELAVQVAEAMTEFSKHMRGVNVVALYGGQRYDVQLRALRQGPQIVVGTPGRLLDHLKRGTLDLSKLSGLVLDEADEMLRMGTYPQYLKERITGRTGHMSNIDTAEFLAENFTEHLQYIWLCHLSKDNNHPELAYKTVEWKLREKGIIVGKDVQLCALKRTTPSELYEFE